MSADKPEQPGKPLKSEKPVTVYRKDYRPPDYFIDRVDLAFELDESATRVQATLAVRRNPVLEGDPPPLVLDGEELTTERVAIDGRALPASAYTLGEERLEIPNVPERFELETEVAIDPRANTQLSGLYCSGTMFCTQCEAMGFRRITWFLDRPDVMSIYSSTITADAARYPVLLSNGNLVADETAGDGRRTVRWEDPHPKPSYLFALVAGDLRCHEGRFTTMSGREVRLEIWVEPENIDRCEHALVSLQKAMKWDEEAFGREYDLDIYMVVAVNDFNMGAMENKGLNVFNTKYVLARPDTATDDDCEGIEGVIGHEYFHNWTGNRVTCRDWFQLTLKEGLTVFRDQEFSGDMGSHAVKRIEEVKILRAVQFAEDAGPMKHPIRPDSYISMDNFYTPTVYNKGAEVIRMLDTLLGRPGFRRGMDLYFERHDGQAVTCDDFVAALGDANDEDLETFKRWYAQPGTPEVEAEGDWDPAAGHYALTLRQRNPAAGEGAQPLQIPIRFGLLGADGRELPLTIERGKARQREDACVLELDEREATWVFSGISEEPVPSMLRNFSAPVRLRAARSREDLAFLMAHDSDSFSRWDAGQELASQLLLEGVEAHEAGNPTELDSLFVEAFGRVLADPRLDHSLRALALSLPAEKVLGQEMEVVAVDALHAVREQAIRTLASSHRDALLARYEEFAGPRPYVLDGESIAGRRIKNTVLAYLTSLAPLGDEEATARVFAQFEGANNMTDSQAALALLVDLGGEACDRALETFYQRWKDDPLVLDKWFSVQALSKREDALDRVLALAKHPDFTLSNPNRMRSLVGVFCSANQVRFHEASGRGYEFLADTVLELNHLNPQIAARMVSQFNPWRRFDAARQASMKAQLERIAGEASLSKDVFEIVNRALSEADDAPGG